MIIQNTIMTTYMARAGNAIATMGQISGGLLNVGRAAQSSQRQMSALEMQTRAFGTTLRYAFAGSVIFGMAGMVTQLKDIQRQMGLISAIGETAGGRPLVGNALSEMLNDSRDAAVDAITPLTQYNDAVINFLSTVSGAPRNQILPIVTDISKAAVLAQVTAEDATKAFTTANVAFGRKINLQNVHTFAQQYFMLTRRAPGGPAAGQQIIQQIGQLSAASRFANITPSQMFGMLLGTLRFGIPPAQAARGAAFLFQTLGAPGEQVAESSRAFRQAGVTNEFVQQHGGFAALLKVLGHARRLGVSRGDARRLLSAPDESFAGEEPTPQELQGLGISGRGIAYLQQTFRRIHALRTAVALMTRLEPEPGTGKSLIEDVNDLLRAEQGHVSDIEDLNKAWQRFSNQAQLQKAMVALNSLALQIAQVFQPVLNLAAKGIIRTQQFSSDHDKLTKILTASGAGVLAFLGVRRLLGLPGGLGLGRAIPGIGKGLIGVQAAQSIAEGGGVGPKGTFTDPLFVTVIGQLFPSGRGIPGVPPGTPVPTGGKGGWFRNFAKVAGVLGASWWLGDKVGDALGLNTIGPGDVSLKNVMRNLGIDPADPQRKFNRVKFPHLAALGVDSSKFGPFGQETWLKFQAGKLSPQAAEQRLARQLTAQQFDQIKKVNEFNQRMGINGAKFQADGELVLNIKIDNKGRVTQKRVHVPSSVYSGGNVPSKRGKRGSIKGDFNFNEDLFPSWVYGGK